MWGTGRALGLPLTVEELCPDFYRLLKLLGIEHIVQLRGTVRIVLFLSCIISLGFAGIWIADLIQFTCFNSSPWTEEGLAQFTCLYQGIGSVVFLVMFKDSFAALCYYDDAGQELKQQKKQMMSELQQQVCDVLARATKRATELYGLLSVELGREIESYIGLMKQILRILHKTDPESALNRRLLIAMARHLHDLRRPALFHFHKLIKLTGNDNAFLKDALRKEHGQSMVQLLAGWRAGDPRTPALPRTETLQEDGDLFRALVPLPLEGLTGSCLKFCCCSHRSREPRRLERVSTSKAMSLGFPERQALQSELRDLTPEEKERSPQLVVLQPVNLVLKWFSLLNSRLPNDSTDKETGASVLHGQVNAEHLESLVQQSRVEWVLHHLQNSPKFRSFLWGTFFCAAYFLFYAHMCHKLVHMLLTGECGGLMFFQCSNALIKKLFGLCCMACYIWSMLLVIWNIDHLDAVLQLHMDMQELQDFKEEIEKLNAHTFGRGQNRLSMIQDIAQCLYSKKHIVDEFVKTTYGDRVPLSKFEDLVRQLEGEHITLQTDPPQARREEEFQPLMQQGP
mmetsp:Transcript_76279/g.135109  ORF Transcript_76279/g.135109 Transcript_76279/m.135109 type:complete len:567 (-) Transcript_76279:41-1741(-)